MSIWARNLDEVIAELRRILEGMNRSKPTKKPSQTGERRPPRPRFRGQPRPINLSGDPMFGIEVATSKPSERNDTTQSGPGSCKSHGNDRFNQILYLTCRCKKGDRNACTAASVLSERS